MKSIANMINHNLVKCYEEDIYQQLENQTK